MVTLKILRQRRLCKQGGNHAKIDDGDRVELAIDILRNQSQTSGNACTQTHIKKQDMRASQDSTLIIKIHTKKN